MTPQQARELIGKVAVTFPVPAWSMETLAAFAEHIEDLDYAMCAKHISKWIREHSTRPTICDIRRETRMDGFVY